MDSGKPFEFKNFTVKIDNWCNFVLKYAKSYISIFCMGICYIPFYYIEGRGTNCNLKRGEVYIH